jgi:hypothetical protein
MATAVAAAASVEEEYLTIEYIFIYIYSFFRGQIFDFSLYEKKEIEVFCVPKGVSSFSKKGIPHKNYFFSGPLF